MDWRRLIPSREALLTNRWLRWLAPWLGHPKLWHWSRRGVVLGVALGVFFGLLIPLFAAKQTLGKHTATVSSGATALFRC